MCRTTISLLSLASFFAPATCLAQAGSFDPAFGEQGIVMMPVVEPFFMNVVHALAEYPDGRILAVGSTGTPVTSELYFARLMPDGSMDAGFGTNGIRLNAIGQVSNDAFDLLLLPDGRFLTAGTADSIGVVARWLESGEPDLSFGSNGHVLFAIPQVECWALNLVRAANSDLYTLMRARYDHYMVHILPEGDLDMAFAPDGLLLIDENEEYTEPPQLALDNSGSALIARTRNVGSLQDAVLERRLPDGNLDITFGGGGQVVVDLTTGSDEAWSAVPLANGNIILTGHTYTTDGISAFSAQFDTQGAAVTVYGNNGISTLPAMDDSSFYMRDAVLQPDGALVLAGFVSHWGIGTIATARLLANGAMDLGYGNSGIALRPDPDPNGEAATDIILGASGSYFMSVGIGYFGGIVKVLSGLEVGIGDEVPLAPALMAYPNPTQGLLTLSLDLSRCATVQGALRAQVRDVTGRMVWEQHVPRTTNVARVAVDVSALDAGTYHICVCDKRQRLGACSVVVN